MLNYILLKLLITYKKIYIDIYIWINGAHAKGVLYVVSSYLNSTIVRYSFIFVVIVSHYSYHY